MNRVSLLLCTSVLVTVWAEGVEIEVTTSDDGIGAECTLRAAVVAANLNTATGGCPAGSPGRDTIILPAGVYTLRVAGANDFFGEMGDLDISEDLTIRGAGADVTTIQACTVAQQAEACPPGEGLPERIFQVFSLGIPVELNISGVTLRHGRAGPGGGGGVWLGNSTSLDMTDCAITDNAGGGIVADAVSVAVRGTRCTIARNLGGGLFQRSGALDLAESTIADNSQARGAGLDLTGVITSLTDVTISGNRASPGAGGAGMKISGHSVPATITRCIIRDNTGASFGGGLDLGNGAATVTGTTFSGNAASLGGGIFVGPGGSATIRASTISDNSATLNGGGLALESGSVTLLNSTVSGNRALRFGGGIDVSRSSTLELNNVTITNNMAEDDGDSGGGGGGLYHQHVSIVEIRISNTIVAGNSDRAGLIPDIGGAPASTPISLGFNLFGDLTGATLVAQETDVFDVDPLLGPLADNGGLTSTHALLPGSPAFDAGDPATPGSGDAACEATDQRGLARPSGSGCDIGAFETQVPDLIVTTGALVQRQIGVETTQQLTANGGIGPVTWSLTAGALPDGLFFSVDGSVSGTPRVPGPFPVTVEVADGQGRTASKDIVYEIILTRPPPGVRLSKFGTAAVRGREVHYFISVRNEGDEVARNIRIAEFLEPWFHVSFVDPIPDEIDVANLAIQGETEPLPIERSLFWDIPELAPGDRTLIRYSAVVNGSLPVGLPVSGTAAEISDITPEQCGDAFREEMKQVLLLCSAACEAIGDLEMILRLPDLFKALLVFDEVEMTFFVQGQLGAAAVAKAGELVFKGPEDCQACFAVNERFAEQRYELCTLVAAIDSIGVPLDPNEKVVLAEPFIPPDLELLFVIDFENVGDVEARDVFVTDALAPQLDLDTVEVLSPDGGDFVALAPGETVTLREREGVRVVVVDGEPVELPFVERWAVSLDAGTRSVLWELENIDLEAGAGDRVILAAAPVADLPSGTEIRNSAEIRFETEEPLTTSETVNVIDTTLPIGSLDPLPAVSRSTTLELSWGGRDDVGEIDHFTILVSAGGRGFEPFLNATQETSALFEAEDEETYEFICVAVDTAGNVEAQPLAAEVGTTVRVARFLRGDCNDDGAVDIADPVALLFAVFLGEFDITCDDACDSNDDGAVDSSDAINTLAVLFLGSGEIPLPGMNACGKDPTEDAVSCEAFGVCP